MFWGKVTMEKNVLQHAFYLGVTSVRGETSVFLIAASAFKNSPYKSDFRAVYY